MKFVTELLPQYVIVKQHTQIIQYQGLNASMKKLNKSFESITTKFLYN